MCVIVTSVYVCYCDVCVIVMCTHVIVTCVYVCYIGMCTCVILTYVCYCDVCYRDQGLVFRDLCVDIKGKRILWSVSGHTHPGAVLAVMGPSGRLLWQH